MKGLLAASLQFILIKKMIVIQFFFLFFLLALPSFITEMLGFGFDSVTGIIVSLTSFLFQAWLQVGFIKFVASDSEQLGNTEFRFLENMKWSLPRVAPFILYLLIYYLLILGGLFIFILPGLIVAVLFIFAPYSAVLGGEKGPLGQSRQMVNNHFAEVFLIAALILLLESFSIIAEFLPAKDFFFISLKLLSVGLSCFANIFSAVVLTKFFYRLSA